MIHDFLAAWELFGDAWLTALLLAALLPMGGVVLVARQQVFLGAAVGQAANLGLALALVLGLGHGATPGHVHAETMALMFAVLAGMAVAVLAMRALSMYGSALEARAAVVFLLGGGAAVLLLAHAPHGLQEVQRLQLSSLLGASPADQWIAGAALLGTVAALAACRDRALLWALDPMTAQVLGQSLLRWDVLVGAWLGGCIGFAIHVAGLLFAFGLGVLPVLVARELTASLRGVLLVAPVVGVVATAAALVVAHVLDLPPGQVAVVVLGVALPLTTTWRSITGRAGRG